MPTLRSVLLILTSAPLMILGTWVPGLEWAGWAYALLALGLLALDWRLAGSIRRFEVIRHHDTKLSLGAENPILVTLSNRDRHPAVFWLRDEPPEAFGIEKRILDGQAQALGEWKGCYHVRPIRRGDYTFGDLNLRWRGPLGLIIRQGRVKAGEPVKVYPNLLDVRRYDLLLKRNRLQEMGLRHSRQFGQGTEFERLREYLPDDDFRRIDWNATARRNRPVTVEYQTERSQTVIAVLDTGRMMQSPVADIAKLDYVVNAVLFLGYVASGRGDRVGMMTFADQVTHYLSPQLGRRQFYRMLERLYAVQSQPVEPDYRRAFVYLTARHRKRALVVIFTDVSGTVGMETLVSQTALLARHSLPLVVTISDPDVYAAARQMPNDSLSVYQRAAADKMLADRRMALENFQRQGILTLDVPANQLSTAVINRYLELKGRIKL
jgi:uncharacterized protein (DUF58 family)